MGDGDMPQMQEGNMPTMLWVKENGLIHPTPVKTGSSDGAYKLIESGLQAGDSVVLSAEYVSKESSKKKSGGNPFMPSPPGRRNGDNGRQR